MESCVELLACPICGARLAPDGGALTCPTRHSYDVAREGYVNLLRTRTPGDTKEMLLARRRFLERGHYAPLSDAINGLVEAHLRDRGGETDGGSIADAGCGEGYYLGRLRPSLVAGAGGTHRCHLGLDASKDAVRLAAKRYKDAVFVVADIKARLPLVDGSVEVLLNVFAPRNPAEFARVTVAGGLLLVVIPAPDHLAELRSSLRLLEIEEKKEQRVVEALADGFHLGGSNALEYELPLDAEDVLSLVRMTPNYWHTPAETERAIRAREAYRARAAFSLLVFRRRE